MSDDLVLAWLSQLSKGNATTWRALTHCLFSGRCASCCVRLRKLPFCVAFHNRYSMTSDPFSVWSEQSGITPWDNKSTKCQEVRLILGDLWPCEISLGHMSETPDQRRAQWPSATSHKSPVRCNDLPLTLTLWDQLSPETSPRTSCSDTKANTPLPR